MEKEKIIERMNIVDLNFTILRLIDEQIEIAKNDVNLEKMTYLESYYQYVKRFLNGD